jgi:hypothetical protein
MLRKIVVAVSSVTLLWAAPSLAQSRLEPATVTKVTIDDASGDAHLKVNVGSGGCTRASDFRVVVSSRAADGGQTLRFGQDACEMFAPQGTVIDLDVRGLRRSDPIFVENPLFVGH